MAISERKHGTRAKARRTTSGYPRWRSRPSTAINVKAALVSRSKCAGAVAFCKGTAQHGGPRSNRSDVAAFPRYIKQCAEMLRVELKKCTKKLQRWV